jgi:hypothetical protein
VFPPQPLPGPSLFSGLSAPPTVPQASASGGRARLKSCSNLNLAAGEKNHHETLFHLTYGYDIFVSPFFCPIFLGHTEATAAACKASRRFLGEVRQWCSIQVAPATMSTRWLSEMRSAIVTRVRDRNLMPTT